MTTAQFAHTEGYREGYAAAVIATLHDCAATARAWLACPDNDPADLPRLFAQRARLEQTSKQQGDNHERNRT